LKTTLLFWAVNFVPVSIILAIFEIWLEGTHKKGPWGKTAFVDSYWEEKLNWKIPFLKYLSRYHAMMFLVVMPLLFTTGITMWSRILEYRVVPVGTSWFASILSYSMMLAAIWLGNSGLEDFFYFLIQSLTGWRTPDALQRVIFKKDFAWFKNWLPPVFGINIPGHWLFCPFASLALLYIRQRWVMQ